LASKGSAPSHEGASRRCAYTGLDRDWGRTTSTIEPVSGTHPLHLGSQSSLQRASLGTIESAMGMQLRLPGLPSFPRLTQRDPKDALRQLERDEADAKAEIRAALDRSAAKHGIRARAINFVIADHVDGLLADAVYEVRRELELEIEAEEPV
jgi:hypothetical protein